MGCSTSQIDLSKLQSLSTKDKELIKKSWSAITNREELGIQIMFRIFQTHDEIKYLWIFASNLETEEEMLKNSQFCYHAKRLAESLNLIVEAVTSTEPVVDFGPHIDVVRLGRRHCHYGVQSAYYPCFEECLLYSLKKCINDEKLLGNDARKAWKNAMQIMFVAFGDGLNSEAKELEDQDKLKSKLNRNSNLF